MDGDVPTIRIEDPASRPLPGGGQRSPWTGRTDGGTVGEPRSRSADPGFGVQLGFGTPVAPGGYAWWYVDGVSQDGRNAITLIGFIGSVFSPYYVWSGRGDPLDHSALNIALYGTTGHRWAMTERGRSAVDTGRDHLAIGPSAMRWDGTALTITIDETTTPFPTRIKGVVRIHPQTLNMRTFDLDGSGRHYWWPVAPSARIEVELSHPALSWSGHGYFDSNRGVEPLEDAFVQWNWCRAPLNHGAAVLYEVESRRAPVAPLALRFDAMGACEPLDLPPPVKLRKTLWRVPRETRAEGGRSHVVRTLEDTPFYSRSMIGTKLAGETVVAMHESLSLDRLNTRIVRSMLPFRMPRRTG
jgi:carotenoid 1,2-hydratase